MGNITLAIPDDLQKKMRRHKEVRWSEVLRKAIQKKVDDLELLERLTSNSRLTQEDALDISRKIDLSVAKKLGLL